MLVATPGRLVDVLKRYSGDGDGKGTVDPTLSALERRIMDAFDEKSSGREGGNGNVMLVDIWIIWLECWVMGSKKDDDSFIYDQ